MMLKKWMPFLAVIFVQFGYAGLAVIAKFALDKGMNQHVFVVYRHIVATLLVAPFAFAFERKRLPKMTIPIFVKIMILGLLEPVIDQNLYYTGMKYTTATFTSAMCNVLPAFAFIMAWILRLENVKVRRVHSQAKIVGTIVTVGGAMLMTLVKGAVIDLPWAHHAGASLAPAASTSSVTSTHQEPVKGALMIMSGCFCWAAFVILQAITLKSYPAELSLTALICLMGSLEGSVFAVVLEGGFRRASWSIHFDSILLATLYGGIVCSGVAYYLQGVVMRTRGPVFVTAFNPLSMIIVAIMGSLILHETLYLGRVIGAMVIVMGLYMVLWGKTKDGQLPRPLSQLPDGDKPVLAAQDGHLAMPNVSVGPGSMEIGAYVAVDLTKVRPTDEPV
ncbi:hypothetical protein SAY86_018169 [Trapa natans]|uniref:WAT1-related protein n=1 Tax=Trapa natans TaxID=22666 RepID=A0AAN7LMX8_TRANT|nr:hypothetical protein SAY86_018169 [Trapa natans]